MWKWILRRIPASGLLSLVYHGEKEFVESAESNSFIASTYFALILHSPKLHMAFNNDITGFYGVTIRITKFCLACIVNVLS